MIVAIVATGPHLVAGGREQQQPEPLEAVVEAGAATLLHLRLRELRGGRGQTGSTGRGWGGNGGDWEGEIGT